MSTINQLRHINFKLQALLPKKEVLIESYKNFVEERTSLISEFHQTTVPKENSNIEDIEISESIKKFIGNLNLEICEDASKSAHTKPFKKCRYHNRGYCKFKDHCRFLHSQSICETFLQKGICNATAMPK